MFRESIFLAAKFISFNLAVWMKRTFQGSYFPGKFISFKKSSFLSLPAARTGLRPSLRLGAWIPSILFVERKGNRRILWDFAKALRAEG